MKRDLTISKFDPNEKACDHARHQMEQEFQERVVKIEPPKHHFVFLIAPDGSMLGLDESSELALHDEADDRVIWIAHQKA